MIDEKIEQPNKEKTQADAHQEPKEITKKDLLEQLEHYVNNFDNLPQHVKFSYATNADIAYPTLIILNILKLGA